MGFLKSQKVRLKWDEPAELVASRDCKSKASEKWWLQPLCIVGFVAVMMPIQYLQIHYPAPGKHPHGLLVSLLLFILWGLFIGYAIPWINRKCPSQVRMRASMITVTRGQRVSYIYYKHLLGYSWSLDENMLVLILHRKKGWKTMIGVPDQDVMRAADQLLREATVTRLVDSNQPN